MAAAGGWLTPARLRRLAAALEVLPNSPVRWPRDEAISTVWARCGGPSEEVAQLVELLNTLDLIRLRDDLVVKSRVGKSLSGLSINARLRAIGSLLMGRGFFNDQARVLVELGHLDADGALVCATRYARTSAPQLIALLSLWDAVVLHPSVVIPPDLLQELGIASSLLPPETELPDWLKERQEVGVRAEMYTVMLLRSGVADPTRIAWVARDSDQLGYDVENRTTTPRHFVEVKGSRGTSIGFNLTENEWGRAKDLGPQYSLYFWGAIELSRPPLVDYGILRALGYPIVFVDLAATLALAGWTMTATNWKVTFEQLAEGST